MRRSGGCECRVPTGERAKRLCHTKRDKGGSAGHPTQQNNGTSSSGHCQRYQGTSRHVFWWLCVCRASFRARVRVARRGDGLPSWCSPQRSSTAAKRYGFSRHRGERGVLRLKGTQDLPCPTFQCISFLGDKFSLYRSHWLSLGSITVSCRPRL